MSGAQPTRNFLFFGLRHDPESLFYIEGKRFLAINVFARPERRQIYFRVRLRRRQIENRVDFRVLQKFRDGASFGHPLFVGSCLCARLIQVRASRDSRHFGKGRKTQEIRMADGAAADEANAKNGGRFLFHLLRGCDFSQYFYHFRVYGANPAQGI